MLSTLKKLSKGSTTVNDAYSKAYDEATKRIDGQLDGHRLLARRAISWITYAQRPLTTTELCHALAIELGAKTLHTDDVYDIEDAISVCAGLVTVDKESDIVRLVHYTTQKYFEHILPEWNPDALEEIAVACLTYLSFDMFRAGSCRHMAAKPSPLGKLKWEELWKHSRALELKSALIDYGAVKRRLAQNPFFDYSAHHWSEHIRPVENATSCSALAFLRNQALIDSATQAAWRNSPILPKAISGLHVTARYGLLYLLRRLLIEDGDTNIGVNSKDDDGRTPLSLAAKEGHEEVVRLLLKREDVNADPKDDCGRSPLSWAAQNGHESVVRLLVEQNDIDFNLKDEDGRTPLSLAAEEGHEGVVRLLLQLKDIKVDSRDTRGLTPLFRAVKEGHEAAVRLLLERNEVDVNLMDPVYGRTPLWYGLIIRHEAIVRLLLERKDINVNWTDKEGWTPLRVAVYAGSESIVRLLVERDDVDNPIKNKDCQTAQWPAVVIQELEEILSKSQE